MKKVIYLGAMLIIGFAHSQVGIGTRAPATAEQDPDSIAINFPKGILHLQGQHYYNDSVTRNLGLVVPRLDTASIAVIPKDTIPAVEGTMVFDLKGKCLRVKTADGEKGWSSDYAGCLVSVANDTILTNLDIYEGMPIRAKKVSAGEVYSLIIDGADNMVYAAGSNGNGRTGVGSSVAGTAAATSTFRMVLAREAIDISAGWRHGLAVDSAGNVWSWGEGDRFRTGQPSVTDFVFPRKVGGGVYPNGTFPPQGVKAVRVEAGYLNSLVLCDDGKVYAFGGNTNGVNGNGLNNSANVTTPQVIGTLTKIKDIVLGRYSAAAIDSTGKVWVWGHQQYGRLGNGSTASAVTTPVNVSFPLPIKQVALGDRHGVAVSEDGKKLYGWGANSQAWGVTGTTVISSPQEITTYLYTQTSNPPLLNSERFNPAADTIVYVAATRFRDNTAAAGTIVITNKNAYAAGNTNAATGLGLGTVARSGADPVAKFSPQTVGSGASALSFTGFQPIYKGAMNQDNRTFKQASIGPTHGLLLEKEKPLPKKGGLPGEYETNPDGTVKMEAGLGYGTGSVSFSQLGAVSSTYTPIYIFTMLKK